MIIRYNKNNDEAWGTCRANAEFSTRVLASGNTHSNPEIHIQENNQPNHTSETSKHNANKLKCLCSKDTCKDEGYLQIIKHTKILHLTNRNYELDKHQNHLQDSVRLWPLAVFGPWTANRFAAIGVPLQSIGSSLKARRSVQTNRSKNLYSIFPIIITPTPFVMNWPARCNDFLMNTTKYAPVQIL